MKKIITIIFLINSLFICSSEIFAQNRSHTTKRPNNQINNYPNHHSGHTPNNNSNHPSAPQLPQPPAPPAPPVLPPPPPMRQDFNTNAMSMNIGQLQFNGINLSANSGAMAEGSSLEIKQLDRNAALAEIYTNCKSNRFIAVGDLYEIKAAGMNQYSALPIKYVLMAKGNVPNDSRLFMLARLGSEIYFIPAKTTMNYGMVIGEVNSCAIYDKVSLIADTSYSRNYIKSFMLACELNSQNKPSNPYYATLSDNDGFPVSAHIFPQSRNKSSFSYEALTIIQPGTSSSLNLYKALPHEKVFVQSIPFTPASNYYFCKIDLSNFEQYYDNSSLSYVVWIGFDNTNIEDIPNALIFRATCCDEEGVYYSTEDQLVYVALPEDNYNSPFSGGNGTSSNPFVITSVSQLDKVRDYKRRFFKLGCDLDVGSYQGRDWLSIGDDENPFNGMFDGNSKTIRNLYINQPEESYQGLFGCIKNGSVRNLKIQVSPSGIIGDSYVGALAGYCSNSRIFQCYSNGVIQGKNCIGGLIGYAVNNTSVRKSISDFVTNTNVDNATIGGLIGYGEDSTVTDCYANTNIVSSGERCSVGGIVAQGERIKLQNCYSTGIIKAGRKGYAGGLSGYMNGCETKGCIAINSRIEGENQGRLAGSSRSSSFIRCYAWEFIRDRNNKNYSEGGFGANEGTKEGRNGESISKGSFYGSSTRNKFWTVNKKVGFNLSSWVFNSGYNLPQLRGMPSIPNPDYLR